MHHADRAIEHDIRLFLKIGTVTLDGGETVPAAIYSQSQRDRTVYVRGGEKPCGKVRIEKGFIFVRVDQNQQLVDGGCSMQKPLREPGNEAAFAAQKRQYELGLNSLRTLAMA